MPERVMKGHSGLLVNDAAQVAKINPALAGLLGDDKVVGNFPTVMGRRIFKTSSMRRRRRTSSC
jgi:hypothetical protein